MSRSSRSVLGRALVLAVVTCAGVTTAGAARAEDVGVCGRSAEGFSAWLGAFRVKAIAEGISRETVSAALGDVRYDGGVVRLDRSQTPFKKTFEEFVESRLTPQRIAMGRRAMTRHADLLAAIYKAYAVPGHVLVAIWGLETDFGAVSGDKPVFRSLATLAYDCRRAERFRGELLSALRIVDNGSLRVDEMRGAWAGELGQTQFLASSYEKYAVDFDGDGRADLLHSTADVLASTAHYLFQHDWLPDGDVGPGTANFVVLGSWNKSVNYQRTIALFAQELAPAERPGKGKRKRTIRITPDEYQLAASLAPQARVARRVLPCAAMSTDLPLLCACGALRGTVHDASPKNGHRITCYCDDCQAFAKFLGRDDITNPNGGTDIYQMAPGRVKLASRDTLACVRLSPKGMHRWYCQACKTPLGNTLGPQMPFIGLITRIVDPAVSEGTKDQAMGAKKRHGLTKFAVGTLPSDVHEASAIKLLAKAGFFLTKWALQGVGKPSPVFDGHTGAPRGELRILDEAERAALYRR